MGESEWGMTDTDKESSARIAALAVAFLQRHISLGGIAAARRDLLEIIDVANRAGSRMALEEATKVFRGTQSGGGG